MTLQKNTWSSFWLILILMIFGVGLFVPTGPKRSSYAPVIYKNGEGFPRSISKPGFTGLFLVQSGRLYLRKQTVRSALVLVTHVGVEKWDERKLKDLVEKNPELVDLVPAPEHPLLGIDWIIRQKE